MTSTEQLHLTPSERLRLDDANYWLHHYQTKMKRELAIVRKLTDLARKRAERAEKSNATSKEGN